MVQYYVVLTIIHTTLKWKITVNSLLGKGCFKVKCYARLLIGVILYLQIIL